MQIYRDILRSAWHILWRHPWLWSFGLLAAAAGNGGEFSAIISKIDTLSREAGFLTSLRQAIISHRFEQSLADFGYALSQKPLATAGVFVLMGIVALIIIWLIIVSQAALIRAAGSLDSGVDTSFTRAAEAGNRHFWPILFLNILARLATYLVMAIAVLPFIISFLAQPDSPGSLDPLILISFIIFVPVAIIISFILKYAAVSVVLENAPWWTALARAVNLFFRNWLMSLEMAGILFAANIVISLVVFALTANTFIGLPFSNYLTDFSLVTFLRFLPAMLVVVAAGVWFSVFSYTAWTILFIRLQSGRLTPKLMRLTEEVPEYIGRWFQPLPSARASSTTSRNRKSR
jgi:hypothetical protein